MVSSGAVGRNTGDLIYVQTPVGNYFTSVVLFPNDGLFHWVVFRWDTAKGICDMSVDALTETVTLANYGGQVYDWPTTMTFQSDAT